MKTWTPSYFYQRLCLIHASVLRGFLTAAYKKIQLLLFIFHFFFTYFSASVQAFLRYVVCLHVFDGRLPPNSYSVRVDKEDQVQIKKTNSNRKKVWNTVLVIDISLKDRKLWKTCVRELDEQKNSRAKNIFVNFLFKFFTILNLSGSQFRRSAPFILS